MQSYKPSPVDTSEVVLPEELVELTERIARNVHDIWAEGRIQDGWVYGTKRDDTEKTTPCLVSYEDLPESEKEYDRRTAMNTLKLIIKLGYELKKTDTACS